MFVIEGTPVSSIWVDGKPIASAWVDGVQVYGGEPVPPEDFNWEVGINFSEAESANSVPNWNNLEKASGFVTAENLTFPNLFDTNEVNRGLTLQGTGAGCLSSTISYGATYPNPNVYFRDWYNASDWGLTLSGLDDSKYYEIRIVGGQESTTLGDYTIGGITRTPSGVGVRPTSDDWNDEGYLIFNGIQSEEGEIELSIATSQYKQMLSLQIREYDGEPVESPLVEPMSLSITEGDPFEFTATTASGTLVQWRDNNNNLLETGLIYSGIGNIVGSNEIRVVAVNISTQQESVPTIVTLVIEAAAGTPDAPQVSPLSLMVEEGNGGVFNGTSESGTTIQWYDDDDNLLDTGTQFTVSDTLPIGEYSFYAIAVDDLTDIESSKVYVTFMVVEEIPPIGEELVELTIVIEDLPEDYNTSYNGDTLPNNKMLFPINTLVSNITPTLLGYSFSPSNQSVLMDSDKTITFNSTEL